MLLFLVINVIVVVVVVVFKVSSAYTYLTRGIVDLPSAKPGQTSFSVGRLDPVVVAGLVEDGGDGRFLNFSQFAE